jgi:hypothetical protein
VDFTSGLGYLSTEAFSLLAPLMLMGSASRWAPVRARSSRAAALLQSDPARQPTDVCGPQQGVTKAVRVDLLACSDIHISFKARFDKP